MDNTTQPFLNKLEAFAASLDQSEQAMFAYLVSDGAEDAEVTGFNFYEGWPCKIADIAPIKVANMPTVFAGRSGTGK